MTDEEIKAMQAENEKLKTDNEALKETITKKDELIQQKTEDVIGARRKYKKLSELSDDEKAGMTEAEIAAKEELDSIHERQEQQEKSDKERMDKELGFRRKEAAKRLVGDNEDLQKKVLENFDRIKDSELAQTPEEIASYMGNAFNMLGDERPDPVHAANTGGGGAAPGTQQATGFADTAAGKQAAAAMGLSYPAATEAKPDAGA